MFHNAGMKRINETFFQSTQAITRNQGDSLAKMVSFLMPDAAVFTVDKDRNISYWSDGAEALLGYKEAELKGDICLAGNQCPQCMQGCGMAEIGKIEGMPLSLLTATGSQQPVLKYAIAYTREDGEFDGGLEVLIPHVKAQDANPSHQDFFLKYGLISQSPEMLKVFELIKRVSQTDIPVLVRGDSGTGKELVARAIHGESPRSKAPFVAINCATLSEGLLESELFGHVKGAFTGAIRNHSGVFTRAKGGTLFLDEVAELSYDLQAKLLRVLESGDFIPIGAEKPVKADVRIVTATHKALRQEVQQGRFRQDLLYRLRVVPIFIPALKARQGDIPVLVQHILQQLFTQETMPQIDKIAMDQLMRYDWPGNVRELKNAIQYALVMFDGKTITSADLPEETAQHDRVEKTVAVLPKSKRQVSTAEIQQAIDACDGNLTQAAKRLGIGRTTLWRKLKQSAD